MQYFFFPQGSKPVFVTLNSHLSGISLGKCMAQRHSGCDDMGRRNTLVKVLRFDPRLFTVTHCTFPTFTPFYQ